MTKNSLVNLKEEVKQLLYISKITGKIVWDRKLVVRKIGEGNGNPFCTLAWKIPWTEEPGRLQSMGSLRVGHN